MSDLKEESRRLALRARPRAVTRISRRTLAAVVSVLLLAMFGVTFWSLHTGQRGAGITVERHNVERINQAEALDRLPKDYAHLADTRVAPPPTLGPPLPGDLGMALVHGEMPREAEVAPPPRVLQPDAVADEARAERVARQREAEEAARAGLFFRTGAAVAASGRTDSSLGDQALAPQGLSPPASPHVSGDGAAAGDFPASDQSHKRAFLDPSGAMTGAEYQRPPSGNAILAGTVISAALITGIDSDLPGKILAAVTQNVYDTATGRYLLIPQGSKLIGEYDSQIAAGQRRVLLVWTRLIRPDASSLSLSRMPGVDSSGAAGLQDGVDSHWKEVARAAMVSTLIGIGAELAAPDRSQGQNQVVVSTRQSLQDTINQSGQALTRRGLGIQPTLTIRPGIRVSVIVDRDITLPPYAINDR